MWGWWKEPSGEFCLVHDWKCLDSIFLPPDAFSSHLNTINLKILEEKFMQSFSNFYCFFGYKKIAFKSSDLYFPLILAMVQSCGKDAHQGCCWCLEAGKGDGGRVAIVLCGRGQITYLVKDLCGGTRIRRKLCLITLSV